MTGHSPLRWGTILLTIARWTLMVWKAKLTFGLLNWYNLTTYQTQFTKPNYTKPNLDEPNLHKIRAKSNPNLSWAWPGSPPVCLNIFCQIRILLIISCHIGWPDFSTSALIIPHISSLIYIFTLTWKITWPKKYSISYKNFSNWLINFIFCWSKWCSKSNE